jgi:hypothetical protein
MFRSLFTRYIQKIMYFYTATNIPSGCTYKERSCSSNNKRIPSLIMRS